MSIIRKPFRYSYNYAVFWLIGINVLVFIAMRFYGSIPVTMLDISNLGITDRFGRVYDHMQLTVSNMFAMMPQAVVKLGTVWSFLTYMFMHGNIQHILFNMLALLIFGMPVERQMGSKEFILFYLTTGILAGIFSFIVYYFTSNPIIPLVGASGAVFAVQLAYAIFFPNSIIYIWGIIPLRAPVMVLGFTALELFSSIFRSNSGVAHLTHLAGFGFAWLYFIIRFNINPWRQLRSR